MPGTFSGVSVVQGSWCMGCISRNMERVGLKIHVADAKLSKGFEGQTEELLLL